MDNYFMWECMESSNCSCNVSRIIASLSGRVETTHRNDETTHRNDETTNRNDKTTNDDELMWSVMNRTRKTTSRRGQPTNRTDKSTIRPHKTMSRHRVELAIRRVELGKKRLDWKYRCAETMKLHNETTSRTFCPQCTFIEINPWKCLWRKSLWISESFP